MITFVNHKLYPSTKRIQTPKLQIDITEKLDGSNLGIFKISNDSLLVAQRNYCFVWSPSMEITPEDRDFAYEGLFGWLELVGQKLIDTLRLYNGFFGEYMFNHINDSRFIDYNDRTDLTLGLYIFAKASLQVLGINSTELSDVSVRGLTYKRDLVKYVFSNNEIPTDIVDLVPLVHTFGHVPSIPDLDNLYEEYCKRINHKPEGFIVLLENNQILKYVRFKGGEFGPHRESFSSDEE